MNEQLAIIETENLSHTIAQNKPEQWLLSAINFRVKAGEMHGITGKSGSGKTTLLHLLSGLIKPTQGKIWLKGKEVTNIDDQVMTKLRQDNLGFVFQTPNLLQDFNSTENIALSQIIRGLPYEDSMQEARTLMEKLGIEHLDNKSVAELSGGEKQRINIARAIIHKPSIIFADEPTGSLDHDNARAVESLLIQLQTHHQISMIIVSHDQQITSRMQYVWTLEKGKLTALNN